MKFIHIEYRIIIIFTIAISLIEKDIVDLSFMQVALCTRKHIQEKSNRK